MTITVAKGLVHLSSLVLMLAAGSAAAADTADGAAESAPRIMMSGSGEAVAPAARATLTVGIETHGDTPAAAGAEGARLSQAVTAALRDAGLAAADFKSTRLVVNPRWVYDEHAHQARRDGFQANTTLEIETATLDRLGAWVDAALGAGATNVSNPRFKPADETALRHLALSRAVQAARGDAEVVAAAAGGSLGAILQISQGPGFGFAPMGGLALDAPAAGGALARGAVPTSIVPSDIHLTATVTGEWRFVAGPGAPGR